MITQKTPHLYSSDVDPYITFLLDIFIWMFNRYLKLNMSKNKCLICPSKPDATTVYPFSIHCISTHPFSGTLLLCHRITCELEIAFNSYSCFSNVKQDPHSKSDIWLLPWNVILGYLKSPSYLHSECGNLHRLETIMVSCVTFASLCPHL